MRLSAVRERAVAAQSLSSVVAMPTPGSKPRRGSRSGLPARPSTARATTPSRRRSQPRKSTGPSQALLDKYPADDPDIHWSPKKVRERAAAVLEEERTLVALLQRRRRESGARSPNPAADSDSVSSDDADAAAVHVEGSVEAAWEPPTPTHRSGGGGDSGGDAALLSSALHAQAQHHLTHPHSARSPIHRLPYGRTAGSGGSKSAASLRLTVPGDRTATSTTTGWFAATGPTAVGDDATFLRRSPVRRSEHTFGPPPRVPPPRPDISFTKDKVGHGIMPSPTTLLSYKQVPRTRIPAPYHVALTVDTIPELEQDFEWRRTADRQWVRTVFPSARPCGRQDALHLDRALEAMLEDVEARRNGDGYLTCADMYQELQAIVSCCYMEALRQVAYHCAERGSVLARVWKRYDALFADFHEAAAYEMDEHRAACDARLAEELRKLEAEREALGKDLQARIDALLAERDALRATLAERDQQLAVMAEEMKSKLDMLRTQVAGLKRQLQHEKDERARERREMEDALTASRNELKKLQDHLADERRRLEGLLNKALNDLSKARMADSGASAGAGVPKKCTDATTQTEATPAPLMSSPSRRRRAGKSFREKKDTGFPKSYLKRVAKYIQMIYKDKILADQVDDRKGNRRQTLPEYVDDWFDHRFGRDPKLKAQKPKFTQAVAYFRTDSLYCDRFGRMWGQFDPPADPVAECDQYLQVLSHVLASVKGKMRSFSRDGYSVNIHLRAAASLVPKVFGRQFTSSPHNTALQQRMHAASFEVRRVQVIDQEVLMQLWMTEYEAHLERQKKILGDLFVACDTDGDGNLDMDEFTAMLEHIGDRLPSAHDIKRLYNAALRDDGSMTKETFVEAYLKMGLLELSSSSSVGRLPGLDESQPPADQWRALKAMWVEKEPWVMSIVEVLEAEVRESLEQRTDKLCKLLEPDEPTELDATIMCMAMVLSEAEAADDVDSDDSSGSDY